MGLFSRYRKPTAAEKKEIEAALSRLRTCGKKIESLDSIDKYITELDKINAEEHILEYYEDQKIKFNVSPRKVFSMMVAEFPRLEKDIIMRGYDRLQRDAIKLTTDAGKKKKAERYFTELEFYAPRLTPQSQALIQQLKSECSLLQLSK